MLLGELTYRLVRDAVEVEAVEPLELKGKAEPVPAYRLVGVRDDGAPTRRRTTRRSSAATTSSRRSRRRCDEAAASRRCRLVTVVGDAGVGKSRLIGGVPRRVRAGRSLVLAAAACRTARASRSGRSPRSVEGAAGIVNDDDPPTEAQAKLASLADAGGRRRDGAPRVGARADGRAVPGRASCSGRVRRLLEHLAAERPLVVVVDDIHWAEPTFLDLIEHLVERVDAPVLAPLPDPARAARGAARLERPASARPRSSSSRSTQSDAKRMIENLLGGGLARRRRAGPRSSTAAEGNPLFVEQLLCDARRRAAQSRSVETARGVRPTSCPTSTSRPRSRRSSRRGSTRSARASGR